MEISPRMTVDVRVFARTALVSATRIALLSVALYVPATFAQSAPHLSAHTFEVGGFVGSSYGLDAWRVMGGGNVTYGINRYILPYAEFSYFPGINREISGTTSNGTPYTIRFDVPIADFHGGVHIRMPIRESRIVPYVVFGMGLLRSFERDYTANFNIGGGQTIPITGTAPASNDFAVNGGGGIRFYTNQRLGFRLEAKAYKPTGNFTNVFGKIEGGFFFQFR
jgi:hypothetical protein